MNRRHILKICAVGFLSMATLPLRALAAAWNKPAFESTRTEDAMRGLGLGDLGPSRDIVLTAPDMAENGAIVQIEVESRIPGTEAIAILVDKNPTPLIANFVFGPDALPSIVTRIKIAESSEVKAIVSAGGKFYSVGRKVEVAVGGCG